MRKLLSVAAIAAGLALAPISIGLAHEGHSHNLPVVNGKVTKVDESAGTITIEHGAIPNLKMDAMTMVLKAADPAMVKTVRAGDAIKFTADKLNGQLTVTDIDKAK